MRSTEGFFLALLEQVLEQKRPLEPGSRDFPQCSQCSHGVAVVIPSKYNRLAKLVIEPKSNSCLVFGALGDRLVGFTDSQDIIVRVVESDSCDESPGQLVITT